MSTMGLRTGAIAFGCLVAGAVLAIVWKEAAVWSVYGLAAVGFWQAVQWMEGAGRVGRGDGERLVTTFRKLLAGRAAPERSRTSVIYGAGEQGRSERTHMRAAREEERPQGARSEDTARSMNQNERQRKQSHQLGWEDLVLPAETLEKIRTTLAVFQLPELRRMVPEPPKGMLLYGPPGTGKTQTARVIASVGGFNFYTLGSAEARGKWIGHGAARIKEIFDEARRNPPAIIFIDEIDNLAADRGGLEGYEAGGAFFLDSVTELLQQMDGLDEHVFAIAATNRPHAIDPAILRRLGVDPETGAWAIEIPLPDASCRSRLLRRYLRTVPLEPGFDLSLIVGRTNGLSADTLKTLCTQAGMRAISRGRRSVTEDDFLMELVKTA